MKISEIIAIKNKLPDKQKDRFSCPINSVTLDGETIDKLIFVKLGSSDSMYIFMRSGNILVMPVHRECPVRVADMDEFVNKGKDMLTSALIKEKDAANKTIDENLNAILSIGG